MYESHSVVRLPEVVIVVAAQYFEHSTYIDWRHDTVAGLATQLADGLTGDSAIVKACFEWVRDDIRHSVDYQLNPVTCKASDVLKHRTGYCYAKSHLLAALLRANGIAAGLCYQRLSLDGVGASYCLHGLNAVYLSGVGWYRIDPRGNTATVNAQFVPPREQLAFPLLQPGERDIPGIYSNPLPAVIRTLTSCRTWQAAYTCLPDLEY
ncbi:MAG: transglutaminase family protein [Cyanobacteria bacterium P01_A01_bin.3]